MADKLIQLKDGADNLYTTMYKETLSGTIGSSLYAGLYYVDLTLTKGTISNVCSLTVTTVQSNRPAYCIFISASKIRVFSPVSDTTIQVMVCYG